MKYALFLTGCLLAFVPSCIIDSDPDREPVVVVGDGLLIVDWSINGTKDPDQCDQGAADTLDLIVESAAGDFSDQFLEDCAAFEIAIDLPPGTYIADAVLTDATGRERTTSVPIDPFRIRGDDELILPIDFPASSFF